jgi:CHAT domain-containing protein/tetratricopeptide (TPR) repeat protein
MFPQNTYARVRHSWPIALCFWLLVATAAWPSHLAAQTPDTWIAATVCKPETAQLIVEFFDNKNFDRALTTADTFLGVARNEFGANSGCTAQALFLRATALQLLGRIEDAGQPFDDAVAMFRKHVKPAHPALSLALNNQGAHRFWMRHYGDAARVHEEALELRRSALPLDELAVADSLHNLADAYRYLSRPSDTVIRLYRDAIAIRERLLPASDARIAQSRQNLADALDRAHDGAGATTQLAAALRIYRQATPRDETAVATILTRQGAHLFAQGKYIAAEGLYREAVHSLRTETHTQKMTLAATLDDFSVNQMRHKKYDEAQVLATEALALRASVLPTNHPTLARTLSNLSEISWLQGRFTESLDWSRKANEITLLTSSFDAAARLRLQRHVRAIWWSEGKPEAPTNTERLDDGFKIAQHATRSGTANTVRNLAARAAASDDRLRAMLKNIDDSDREQGRLELKLSHASTAATGLDQNSFASLRTSLTAIAERRKLLLAEIRQAFPRYDQLVRPEPLSVAEAQTLLGPDEALVTYLVGFNEIYAWAVTREAVLMRQLAMYPQDLTVAVAKLRAALQVEPTSTDREHVKLPLFSLATAHDLYGKLLAEFAPVIASKTQLVIVPSGSLTSLPFHLLVRSKPKIAEPTRQQAAAYRDADWLARHHAITVLPSVESLKALRTSSPSTAERRPLVAFANPLPRVDPLQVAEATPLPARVLRGVPRKRGAPSLWDGGALQLEKLRAFLADKNHRIPETAGEVDAVANTLRADQKDIFSGSAATEAGLKRMDLSKYRVVYFATHGFVTGAFGVGEPSLALTAPETATEEDDGLLTASEIAALKLDADLVVLSACDTAAGDQIGAEGLSGLARAFFHAGARSMLVSHWAVDSLDTKTLMQTLFAELEKQPGLHRSVALQRAMVARVTGATGKDVWNAYPGRWAPFELVGGN